MRCPNQDLPLVVPRDATPVLSLDPGGRLPAASEVKEMCVTGGGGGGGAMGSPFAAADAIAAQIFMSSLTFCGMGKIRFSSPANCFMKFKIGQRKPFAKGHICEIASHLPSNCCKFLRCVAGVLCIK